MEKRAFGRTGLMVSPLGFGAAPMGFLVKEQEQTSLVVNALLDAGVNLIDTAAGYAGSEEALGNTISHRRHEFVLVSKCGQKFDDLPGEAWSKEMILATIDRALIRLKTDHLDVMLLHTCGIEVLHQGEALGALVDARQAGKIRFAGYSGDNQAVAYAASLPDVSVVETSINLVDQVNVDTLLPITEKQGQGVLAKRPVANAAWRQPEEQPGFYKDYASDYHARFKAMGLRLDDFEVEDWSELALRFTLSVKGVHTAIIGTTSLVNARKNVANAGKGPLPAGHVAKIRELFLQHSAQSESPWLGLT